MKKSILTINLKAIKYNYNHLKCHYKKKIIAVLKDDAYGLGIKKIVSTLMDDKDLVVAVNSFKDLENIKEMKVKKLYLNIFDKDDLLYFKENKISVVLSSLNQLEYLKNSNIPFHIKINVGMNRIGLNKEEYLQAINIISTDRESYNLEGIMCHFPTSDANHSFYNIFKELVTLCPFYKNLMIHCFASSSIFEESFTNYIRVGIKLYGVDNSLFYQNCLYLNAPIIQKKFIKKGEKVGYDLAYAAISDGYLYLLPIGYGQGWGRFIDSYAFFDNHYLKQIGKISMDYSIYFSTIDLNIGENIELIGNHISLKSLATINYQDVHEVLIKIKVDKDYLTYL